MSDWLDRLLVALREARVDLSAEAATTPGS
jgi:hypothetical protein